MRGVSKVTQEKLVRVGIEKVVDLKYLDDCNETMESISNETNTSGKGFTMSVLHKFVNLARTAHRGNPPQTVDYHQALNPYKSLYGEQWEEKIRGLTKEQDMKTAQPAMHLNSMCLTST
eukprot:13617821-Ditylum_brightwellii.AAC.1